MANDLSDEEIDITEFVVDTATIPNFMLLQLFIVKSQFVPHLRTIYRFRFDKPAVYIARK